MKKHHVGQVATGKLGVYAGTTLLGQVGSKATSATCRRFGSYGAELGRVNNCPAWIGEAVPQRANVRDSHERRKRARK